MFFPKPSFNDSNTQFSPKPKKLQLLRPAAAAPPLRSDLKLGLIARCQVAFSLTATKAS